MFRLLGGNAPKASGVSLIIQIDTRDKPDKITHITNYFNEHGVKWVRSKCVVGDRLTVEHWEELSGTKERGSGFLVHRPLSGELTLACCLS